ncbi:hypothetical protein [Haloplasma contractile]|uniref:Uncharacterized protein n=1 Tax=Haloplasma contractile SSD-17B TaxID=1033810 RepID=U2FS54_9MOLU|nr:hypothetical protein [Haloplasma contractile]ERJ13784.1 hypothetical protein HLPCO_000450 [Haloplasma contractile SSD-17B]
MKRKRGVLNNKKGYVLPYTLLLMVLLLNIFTLSLRLYLNEVMYYEKKHNHYQIMVVEERVKRHIINKIVTNQVVNMEKETIYYEHTSCFILYLYDYTRNDWKVNVTIRYKEIKITRDYLYTSETMELTIDTS